MVNTKEHDIKAQAYVSHTDLYRQKNFNTYGGEVSYYNKPNEIGGSVGAALTPGEGTKYNVQVDKNIWRSKDGRASVNLVGSATKVVGGAQGPSDWQIGFGVGTAHGF